MWELKAVRVAGAALGAAVKAPSSAGGAGPGAAAAVPVLGEVQGFSVHRIGVGRGRAGHRALLLPGENPQGVKCLSYTHL